MNSYELRPNCAAARTTAREKISVNEFDHDVKKTTASSSEKVTLRGGAGARTRKRGRRRPRERRAPTAIGR